MRSLHRWCWNWTLTEERYRGRYRNNKRLIHFMTGEPLPYGNWALWKLGSPVLHKQQNPLAQLRPCQGGW